MNTLFIVGSLLVAGCSAQYWVNPYLAVHPLSVGFSSQYHAQDELGQFAFGHHSDTQTREEVKSVDGAVRGAYSYVDPTGKLIHVQYLADHNGFRVLGANNLPVAPEVNLEVVKDTPEVVAARAEFARKFDEAKSGRIPEVISRRRRDLIHTPIISTLLAKTTLKTNEFVPVDAKVPAATKLAEIKEKEHEIITPYHVPSIISTPLWEPSIINPNVVVKTIKPLEDKKEILASSIWTPSILTPSVAVKTVEPIEEKKEVLPIVSSRFFASPILQYSTLPLVGKTTIKTSELKPLDDKMTPAATRLAEIKEFEKDIWSPLTWSPSLLPTHRLFI